MSDQPRISFEELEVGKKYFSRRTSVDYMIFLVTHKEEKGSLPFKRGLFIKWLNVSYSSISGMFTQTGKSTIIYPGEYHGRFPNAYVLRRKHYSMIFDMIFK